MAALAEIRAGGARCNAVLGADEHSQGRLQCRLRAVLPVHVASAVRLRRLLLREAEAQRRLISPHLRRPRDNRDPDERDVRHHVY